MDYIQSAGYALKLVIIVAILGAMIKGLWKE